MNVPLHQNEDGQAPAPNDHTALECGDTDDHEISKGDDTSTVPTADFGLNGFRQRACETVHYVAHYLETIGQRKVFPDVLPGYLASMIPTEAPEYPESWENIMGDVERVVMPGMTHWHHPHFHAYFPAGTSSPSICADILTDGLGCIGFTWASSPACTELEVVMMDWLARILRLPDFFMSGGKGGGVISGSASDSTLVALFGARNRSIKAYQDENPTASVFDAAAKLIGYYSDQAHSSVERAGLISMLRLRPVQSNEKHEMTGEALEEAVLEDLNNGLIPFFCTATLGTTGCCAFDHLEEIGQICKKYNIWLHVDAAYAGSSFICPEYRPLLNGIEHAMSFVFNPHKWLLVNFDCSCVWYKDVDWVIKSFNVDPAYLKHQHQGKVPDFRHWHIPLGRKFRSLKLWFLFRYFGVEALRNYIRNHISLAQHFESLVRADNRFEIVHDVRMALVCFRLMKNNDLTRQLYQEIENDGRIHLTPSEFHHPEPMFFIRFAVCYHSANMGQIQHAFDVICELTTRLLRRPSVSLSQESF
ncbi:Aromatic-L-amino-acid decarboxylase [Fasciola hepatica]|uniref:Aromatic-L-amino-acid decarboxylase n=1 Tax=Fasciola hepatica TaxID=6192 RepID=A0A4E0R602_FASHE|nr:Aromatic-L-amino-acid decarboxylase [Fasciola hepatica]